MEGASSSTPTRNKEMEVGPGVTATLQAENASRFAAVAALAAATAARTQGLPPKEHGVSMAAFPAARPPATSPGVTNPATRTLLTGTEYSNLLLVEADTKLPVVDILANIALRNHKAQLLEPSSKAVSTTNTLRSGQQIAAQRILQQQQSPASPFANLRGQAATAIEGEEGMNESRDLATPMQSAPLKAAAATAGTRESGGSVDKSNNKKKRYTRSPHLHRKNR